VEPRPLKNCWPACADDSGQYATNLIRDPRFVDFRAEQSYQRRWDIPSPIKSIPGWQYTITHYGMGDRLDG